MHVTQLSLLANLMDQPLDLNLSGFHINLMVDSSHLLNGDD
jgi:hypothetical protein